MKRYINVNELNNIIAKHFKKKYCNTVSAEIGTINEQNNPKVFHLGGGSILTILFELND